jgi:RNA polymerase sigma-70 factor (ECF subfamily)
LSNEQEIWEKLVQDARHGQRAAVNELYDRTNHAMYGVAIRMLGDRQTAEDVLQEAYIIALDKLGSLRSGTYFVPWFKRIVINKCLLELRKRVNFRELTEHSGDPGAEDEDMWWTTISMEAIQAAIQSLPDGCRVIFTLYAVEEHAHAEIASMLGISESTSKTQYRRAKLLLKAALLRKATI